LKLKSHITSLYGLARWYQIMRDCKSYHKFNRSLLLSTEAFCLLDNKLWYSAGELPVLCCFDMNTKENKFIDYFPMTEINDYYIHSNALFINDKIVFMPGFKNLVHIFDINNKKINVIKIPTDEKYVFFKCGFFYKDFIYILLDVPKLTIYKVDLKNNTVEPLNINFNKYNREVANNAVIVDNYLFLGARYANLIGILDLDKMNISWRQVENLENGVGTIAYDGNYFWLSSTDRIIKWNETIGTAKIYTEFPDNYGTYYLNNKILQIHKGFSNFGDKSAFPFCGSEFLNGSIYFFPRTVNMSLFIDNQDIIKTLILNDEEETAASFGSNARERITHYFVHKITDKIMMSSSCSGKFYIIDDKSNIFEYKLLINENDLIKYFKDYLNGNLIERLSIYTLDNYLNFININNSVVGKTINELCGKTIYNKIIK